MTNREPVFLILSYLSLTMFIHLFPFAPELFNDFKVGTIKADSWVHFVLFLPWIYLGTIYKKKRAAGTTKFKFYLSWLTAGILLAVGVECIHFWLPYRVFNLTDMTFNIMGVLLGSAILLFKR